MSSENGMEGYLELWRNWLEPYASYRVELEEYFVRLEFHLDRERAMRAAGLAE